MNVQKTKDNPVSLEKTMAPNEGQTPLVASADEIDSWEITNRWFTNRHL